MRHTLLPLLIFLIGAATYAQDFIVTNGATDNTCSGTLYDPAGPNAGVGSNQNVTYTICPDAGEDLRIALDFQVFIFGFINSSVVIYDGEDTSAPQIFTSVGLWPGVLPFIVASDPN